MTWSLVPAVCASGTSPQRGSGSSRAFQPGPAREGEWPDLEEYVETPNRRPNMLVNVTSEAGADRQRRWHTPLT